MAAGQTEIESDQERTESDQKELTLINMITPMYRDFREKQLGKWVSQGLGDYLFVYLASALRLDKMRERILSVNDERTPESVKQRNLEAYYDARPPYPRPNPRRADIVLECRFDRETLIFVGETATTADADDVERAQVRSAWIRDHLHSDRQRHVYVEPLVIGVAWADDVARAAHEAHVPCLQVALDGETDSDGLFIPEGIAEWHAMPDFERRMRYWLSPLWPAA